MFADLDAADIGGNRFEFAADFRGRVHLEIEDVLMRRSAREENHDDSLVRSADAGLRFGLQELGQRQAAQTQGADFKEISAGNSVAEPLSGSVDRQHKRWFCSSAPLRAVGTRGGA